MVWCTLARVEMVLNMPTAGDSTPGRRLQEKVDVTERRKQDRTASYFEKIIVSYAHHFFPPDH